MSESGRVSLKERFTRVEFVVVMFVVTISLLIFSTALPRPWSLKQRQNCQENLKTIGEALRMYADEAKGEYYPPQKSRDCSGEIQPWSGAIDLTEFHPEYLADLDLLVCPAYPAGDSAIQIWDEGKTTNPRWEPVEGFSHNGDVEPCEVLAKPYYYYGWALSEATFESALRSVPRAPEDIVAAHQKDGGLKINVEFDRLVHMERFKMAVASLTERQARGELDAAPETWNLTNAEGKPIELPIGSTIGRLREGAERVYIYDVGNPAATHVARAKIVVLHEELFDAQGSFYHGAGRINILYMDGHVECRTSQPLYAAPFPLNEAGAILHDAVEGTLSVPTSATAEAASE